MSADVECSQCEYAAPFGMGGMVEMYLGHYKPQAIIDWGVWWDAFAADAEGIDLAGLWESS